MKLFVFTPECFETFFTRFDFFDAPCLKITISKALSYAIIAGAVVLKLPQILKIASAGSVQGLAALTFYCDVLIFSCSAGYSYLRGFPFSTYGEELVILAQNIFLVLLLWKYADPAKGTAHILLAVGIWGGFVFWMLGLDPEGEVVTMLPVATIIATALARCPQVYANYSQGHTGQLSIVSTGLNWVGSLARIFTTLTELSDTLKLMGYVVSASLNLVLIFQMLWYWTATKNATAAAAEKKAK